MTNDDRPLVTVVTPVYNTEKYLEACLESVLEQTYDAFELIVVDNCSTDDSRAIAERFAARDPRVRIHANERFLSQMENWNHALGLVSPESAYCKVLHADDWMFPECLERMVAVGEGHPSVGVIGSYRLNETEVDLGGLPYPSPMTPGREVARLYFLEGTYLLGAPSNLLFRSDAVRGRQPFYDEENLHADVDAGVALLREWDFGFVHQVLTYTRRHNESTSSKVERLATRWFSRMGTLQDYGPEFLSADELRSRERVLDWNYYRMLAQQVLELREREFWDFHRAELRKLGRPMRWPYLGFTVLVELLDLRGSAKRLFTGLRRRLAAGRGGDRGRVEMTSFRKESKP